MTNEQKEGVEMILFLQSTVGIEESEEDALKGWEAMTDMEKESTRSAYSYLNKEVEDA